MSAYIDTLEAELDQLDAIVADCRDLEQPVPVKVRRRRKQIVQLLAQLKRVAS